MAAEVLVSGRFYCIRVSFNVVFLPDRIESGGVMSKGYLPSSQLGQRGRLNERGLNPGLLFCCAWVHC